VLGADNAGRPLFAPFGKTADVTSWIPLKTEFHSLQVKIDRRFANGILFTNSYTLGRGKSFNTGDSNSGIPTPADLDRSWARTDQDRLHNVVSSFLYQLPFGPDRRWVKTGALSQILGGWQVSGFFTAMSGLPINFTASATNLRAPGNTQRPDATGKPEVFGDVGQDVLWFDTSVFSAPAPNTWGNVQRNALLDGPSLVNLDATIAKLFALPRGARGEFRVDIFNLTNTPHFARPGGGFGSSTFGRNTATEGGADMRSMRFGLKVTF
jgi:hypothetical protein